MLIVVGGRNPSETHTPPQPNEIVILNEVRDLYSPFAAPVRRRWRKRQIPRRRAPQDDNLEGFKAVVGELSLPPLLPHPVVDRRDESER